MGTPNKESAQKQVEIAKANVESKKEILAKTKERLAYAKKSPNWKTTPKNCGYPGKPGSYRSIEVEVFLRQHELEEAKKHLEQAKKDLAQAKKK